MEVGGADRSKDFLQIGCSRPIQNRMTSIELGPVLYARIDVMSESNISKILYRNALQDSLVRRGNRIQPRISRYVGS